MAHSGTSKVVFRLEFGVEVSKSILDLHKRFVFQPSDFLLMNG